MKEKAEGADVVEETLRRLAEARIFPDDHGFMRRIAFVESRDGTHPNTFRDPKSEAGVGIWQMDKGTFVWLTTSKRDFKTTRENYYGLIKKRFKIDISEMLERKELYKPLVAALLARVYLLTKPEKIPPDMEDQAKYWKKHYNTEAGSGTVEKFKSDMKELLSKERPSSGSRGDDKGRDTFAQSKLPVLLIFCLLPVYIECQHGVRNPSSDCKCLCEKDYTGRYCDQPKCGECNPQPCSGKGVCAISPDDGKPRCRCFGRWEGGCCKTLPPAPVFGDPHIRTIDGKNI